MIRTLVTFVLLGLLVASAHAAEPSPPATLLTKPGKLLIHEDLSQLPAKGDWRYGPGAWTIEKGVLQGSERSADKHGAVLRRTLNHRDAVIQYEFRFDGAKATTLSINDAKEHVCRVMLNPKGFRVQKDDHDHAGPDKAVVFESKQLDIAAGQWHTLIVEMCGPDMVATLDGRHTAFGSHPMLECEKANFGFTVAGESMSFRNVQVWEATPSPTWAAAKAALEKARTPASP